ncbi:MAG TPA: hypothetical protein VN604_04795 [Nitrospirota bacterium]|nr:hypothetical protein [Nitrospirota bacterium]
MKVAVFISIVLVIPVGTACGPRQFYDGLRFGQEMECQGLQKSDQDECMRRSGMSYDEYQKQLKERQGTR